MSEQLQSWVGLSATATGRRLIVRALLISLSVHAALVGGLWHTTSTQRPPMQRELRLELSSSTRPTTATALAQMPSEPRLDTSERKIKGRTPLVRSHTNVPQPTEHETVVAETGSSSSSDGLEAELATEVQSRKSQEGTFPIDLRVVDWLAQYRLYPLAARRARIEGVVQLRVILMPDGRLVGARVEQSSGHPLLDQAALDLLARASPLPVEFGSARTEQIELQLPIVYRMRT